LRTGRGKLKSFAAQRATGDFVTRKDVLFVQKEIKTTVQHQMNAKYSEKMSSNPEILGKAIATWWFKRSNELDPNVEDDTDSVGPATETRVHLDEAGEPKGQRALRASRAVSEVPVIGVYSDKDEFFFRY
jgi:hypothetical protein